jgi:uncharacterized protein YceK
MKSILITALALGLLSGCSGVRTTNSTFSAHAENFNFLYIQIPGGDTQERALELLPEGAQIDTLYSTPHDNTSFFGIFSRIIGVEHTTVNGQIKK